MAENLDQDPQQLRAQGNANASVAPFYRAIGDPDPEFHDSFDTNFGLAAYAMRVRLAEYSDERQTRWNGIGDFHDHLHQASHHAANAFEDEDAAGAAATRADDTDV